jgi:hypothetical protein
MADVCTLSSTCIQALQVIRYSSFADLARILQPESTPTIYVHVYFYPGDGRRQEFSEDWNSFRKQAPGLAKQLGISVDDLIAGTMLSFTLTLYFTSLVL